MIPKGGKFAKSVVNFVHQVPQNWGKFKSAIQQIDDLLKQGKLKLDGKQKTNFESNKNILKIHEKVTKKVEVPPPVKKDPFLGWKPTLVERSKARDIYQELAPPKVKYTKEMEKIDEELDALAFGGEKYRLSSEAEKIKKFKSLQTEMEKLIKAGKEEDLTTLSLSKINKKSQNLQKRIREIADNPNIKGTVTEGPKADMIKALYDSENAALTKARHVITKRNSEFKYGKKYPVLDPENDMFIVLGLDERGNPIKISRTIGKFSATKDKTTGELTSAEGTSFYDKWNAKTGTLRKEGEEVFTNTLNREGKEIMFNPDYKIPKTPNLDIQTEFYTDLSTNDLVKKGYKLKDIDMIVKGRKVREYLDKTKSKDTYISMHEQTNTNEIGAVLEDLYNRGDDIYKMSIKEWTKKIPEYFAGGGRAGFDEGGGISGFLKKKVHKYTREGRDEAIAEWLESKGIDLTVEEWRAKSLKEKIYLKFWRGQMWMPEMEKGVDYASGGAIPGFATGGVSNLFRQRQGFRTGNIAKLPEFLKFVERLLIKASNEIRQGIGKWKGLNDAQKVAQHDNLTKLATEFQKTKKFDVRINEYTGIDAEKAFVEAQAKVKSPVKKDRVANADELDDYIEILDPTGEAGVVEEGMTIKTLDKMVAEHKAYVDDMYKQYKRGDLDKYVKPEVLEEQKLFRQKKIDDVLAKAYDEVFYQKPRSGDYKYDADVLADSIAEQLGKGAFNELPQTYQTQIHNTALKRVTQDMALRREANKHMKDVEQKIELQMFDTTGKKGNAEGGLIDGYATGGVSNLFRRR